MQVNTYITSATDALGNVLQYDTQKHSSQPRFELATHRCPTHYSRKSSILYRPVKILFSVHTREIIILVVPGPYKISEDERRLSKRFLNPGTDKDFSEYL